jgi:anti-sigma B factor antagonist/stage II sporulation protein AA (anti-sigma F factor antagonist)
VQLAPQTFAEATVAAPRGRIDHLSAAGFEAALAPLLDAAIARRGALVLDFAGVDYISSVGLRVLMLAARRMREAQAPLALAALQSVVAEIFAISRFDKVLAVQPSVAAALAGCSADAQAAYAARAPR